MLKVIVACGAGVGTSLILKIKATKIFKELNVLASIEALSVGQAKSFVNSTDMIISSTHLIDQFDGSKRAKLVAVKNLMDEKELKAAIEKGLNG